MRTRSRLALLAAALAPTPASAHVKWFTEWSWGDAPQTWTQIASPNFWLLLTLSAVAIALGAWVDARFAESGWRRAIDAWLEAKRSATLTVMRVGVFSISLLCWQADAILVPELSAEYDWAGWLLFIIALLTLFDRTVPLAGAGLLGVYALGLAQFGWLHMLDYALYAGAGYYLIASAIGGERVRRSALPALYFTVGFSLFWVALEKLVYPEWALAILAERTHLTLGLDPEFFLVGAAFVEMSLGYVLILGLMSRPIALVVTLVFFATTLVFGKLEVIGHTLIHASLIVFLIEGSGRGWTPPVRFHRPVALRMAFAGVNFVLLFALLIVPYLNLAWSAYRHTR